MLNSGMSQVNKPDIREMNCNKPGTFCIVHSDGKVDLRNIDYLRVNRLLPLL